MSPIKVCAKKEKITFQLSEQRALTGHMNHICSAYFDRDSVYCITDPSQAAMPRSCGWPHDAVHIQFIYRPNSQPLPIHKTEQQQQQQTHYRVMLSWTSSNYVIFAVPAFFLSVGWCSVLLLFCVSAVLFSRGEKKERETKKRQVVVHNCLHDNEK